ncbi:MAG TPA: signal peptidase II [Mycobacteriales bacterium]|jgi:signal peptidase II|nr:signal peptidase II [Mycobacteriales bacterium]
MQAARGAAVAAEPPEQIAAHRRTRWLATTAAVILVADVVSKQIVVAKLSDRAPVHVLGHFLMLTLTRNPGAAFSIGPGITVVFTAVAVGVAVVIIRTARSLQSRAWATALGLLLGGALGNLADRVFRSPAVFRGYVIDWIQLPHWPVFNLADSAIVTGGLLAVLLATRGIELDGSRR